MALRVSLQIDGDASGAEQAAKSASESLKGLGKNAADAAKGLEDAFNRASGAAGKMSGAAVAAGAVNDNAAASAAKYASGIGDLAGKALGAENALTKAASGAAGFFSKFADVSKAAGSFTFLTGAIGLSITAATTFYSLLNSRGPSVSVDLSNHEELINRVKSGYGEAAKKAAEFYAVSGAATRLRLIDEEQKISSQLREQVGSVISKTTTFGGIGEFFSGIKQVKGEFLPFEDALFKIQAGMKAGKPDVKAFLDEVGRVVDISPEYTKAAIALVNFATGAEKSEVSLKQNEASMARVKGIATEASDAFVGILKSSGAATNEFDRMTKALSRQIIVQEAEAQTVGKSAAASAKLRAELLLKDAALRSGIEPIGKYAAAIDVLAGRLGNAAQKAAEMQLKSGAAFDLSQLGRSASEQNIAGMLRGVYGDNVDGVMNSAIAGTLRFNAAMMELKSTTLEVSQGVFRDFRTELMNGTSMWQAFGTAGVNALNRIIDKLADKALDSLVSNLFGSFLGGSSGGGGGLGKLIGSGGGVPYGAMTLGGAAGPTPFFAAAGGNFGPGWGVVGEEGPEIIKVAYGGVTVFPHAMSKPHLPGFAAGGSLSALGAVSRLASSSQPAAVPMQFHSEVNINVNGNADDKALETMRREFQSEMDRRDANFANNVIVAVKSAQEGWKL